MHNSSDKPKPVLCFLNCWGAPDHVTMSLLCRWMVSVALCLHCTSGLVNIVSKEDILLLKDLQNPKCFTRTLKDFTCFFETFDNKTYDLIYDYDSNPSKCAMSVQSTAKGSFLHICSFSDVQIFVKMDIKVVELASNTVSYHRTLSVEDNYLPDPPFNLTLQPNGPGQLEVSWLAKTKWKIFDHMTYKIRYSTGTKKERTVETDKQSLELSLTQGEEVEVQVSVKCGFNKDAGHWSSWTQPVHATVPQRADDISLTCSTFDLKNVTCHWNGFSASEERENKLFYKMEIKESPDWTPWSECGRSGNITNICHIHGNESKEVMIMLISTSTASRKTFFTKAFKLKNSIKTFPPSRLRGTPKKQELCLDWEAPPLFLETHLQYEVDINIRGGERWKMIKESETRTCMKVPAGSHFTVKIRAKPAGPIYSGNWSDWSEEFTGEMTPDMDAFLVGFLFITPLIIGVVFIPILFIYRSKLKHYFWPPVPNLEKVLQGFLTEVSGQKLHPPPTAKQCFEETTSSVVEILSESDIPQPGKLLDESSKLLLSTESFPTEVQVIGSPGTEVFLDYVTLKKELPPLCLGVNFYLYDPEKGSPDTPQSCVCFFPDGSSYVSLCAENDFLNDSYLPMVEPQDSTEDGQFPGNSYTNVFYA
ncbi:Thrombopoietin receptor [Oryzias melastigma]|uniref:Thrombopoietin receptor n=1 Tax=Oryzias melastigma TaxID=30732 RepID=A0A834CQS2_ORYME|nr:Thrombopoietin receptor [Oryzias melastigma]